MSLFSHKPEMVALVLYSDERRLAVRALMWWRNQLLQQGKLTEDINEILIKLMA